MPDVSEGTSRYVGIDVGDTRVGVSISNESKTIAFPLAIVERENNSYGFKKIKTLLIDKKIEAFVIGLPVRSDGTLGKQGEKVINYCESLKEYFKTDVISWDERYTTVIAQKSLIETNSKLEKRKKAIDDIAAQLILQSYLDHINKIK
jgi:putative Holliday junction resolvase